LSAENLFLFIYNIHLAAPRTLLAGGGRIIRTLPITPVLPANYLQYLTVTGVGNSQPVLCVRYETRPKTKLTIQTQKQGTAHFKTRR